MQSCIASSSKQVLTRQFSTTSSAAKITKAVPKKKVVALKKPAKDVNIPIAGGKGSVHPDLVKGRVDFGHLPKLSKALLSADSESAKSARYSSQAIQAFAAFGLPRKLQNEFALSKTPATVISSSSKRVKSLLAEAASSSSASHRHCLIGKPGTGKSVALLQAIDQAFSNGYLVLYIPSAIALIDSSSPIAYDQDSQVFRQDALASSILKNFAAVNKEALRKITEESSGKTLFEIINTAAASSRPDLNLAFEALSKQSTTPVLLAIDSAQALFRKSDYLSPTSDLHLDSFALSVPRILLEFINGAKTFSKGAVLLSSSSSDTRHQSAAFDVATKKRERDAFEDLQPYGKIMEDAKLGFVNIEDGLGRQEASELMQTLAENRLVRGALGDRLFLQKYIASSGSPGQFRKAVEASMH